MGVLINDKLWGVGVLKTRRVKVLLCAAVTIGGNQLVVNVYVTKCGWHTLNMCVSKWQQNFTVTNSTWIQCVATYRTIFVLNTTINSVHFVLRLDQLIFLTLLIPSYFLWQNNNKDYLYEMNTFHFWSINIRLLKQSVPYSDLVRTSWNGINQHWKWDNHWCLRNQRW